MQERDWLAERFQAHRTHLRAVAYRMLGALAEADHAVQEAWLRVSRAGAGGVEKPGGWLTTIVARICLDMLRTRRVRREGPWTSACPTRSSRPRTPASPSTRPWSPRASASPFRSSSTP